MADPPLNEKTIYPGVIAVFGRHGSLNYLNLRGLHHLHKIEAADIAGIKLGFTNSSVCLNLQNEGYRNRQLGIKT